MKYYQYMTVDEKIQYHKESIEKLKISINKYRNRKVYCDGLLILLARHEAKKQLLESGREFH